MRLFFYLLFLFEILGISVSYSQEKSLPDYWRDARVVFKDSIKTRVTTEQCYKSYQRFNACIRAVNTYYSHFLPALELAPSLHVGTFGMASLEPKNNVFKKSCWLDVFEARERSKIPFEVIMNWIEVDKSFIKKDFHEVNAEALVELFSQTEDPYETVLPTDYWNDACQSEHLCSSLGTKENVEASVVVSEKKKLGSVRIKTFRSKTCESVKENISDLFLKEKLSGLIIDLQDSPGGLFTSALCIANLFLKKGALILTQTFKNQTKDKEFFAQEDPLPVLDSIPVIILTNANTTSSAEILAGSLQATGRALVVGEPTRGKREMQEHKPLEENPNVIHFFTTSRYVFPEEDPSKTKALEPNLSADLSSKVNLPKLLELALIEYGSLKKVKSMKKSGH